MSLLSIRLQNFRSFLDTGRIELRPIVVLVGANNSGKSSLLRFFPLLRQTMETRTRGPLLWFGDDVDFGGFEQARCREAKEKVIVVEMEMEGTEMNFPTYGMLPRIWTRSEIAEHGGTTYLSRLDLRFEGKQVTLRAAPDDASMEMHVSEEDQSETLFTERLNVPMEHGLFPPLWNSTSFHHDTRTRMAERFETLIRQKARPGETLSPGNIPDDWWKDDAELKKYSFLIRLDTTCMLAHRTLEVLAGSMGYIGPARVNPQRFYRVQQLAVDRIDPQGQNLAMFLRMLPEPDQDRLSDWIERHFGFRIGVGFDGSHMVLRIDEHGRTCNLADTGYGFSQLLPIAVQCWAAATGAVNGREGLPPSLIAIEQPELHLHPSYQARLADMLAGLVSVKRQEASWGPRVIVETHSEALLERLGELVEQGRLERKDVLVLLVERDAATGVSSVRQSEFDEKGVLENWPIGFFSA